jgi:protein BCP1
MYINIYRQVDLGLFDAEEKDFLGLKTLFFNLLDGEDFDSSGMADLVLKNRAVQSVIKTDEKEDPLGLISVLNLHR